MKKLICGLMLLALIAGCGNGGSNSATVATTTTPPPTPTIAIVNASPDVAGAWSSARLDEYVPFMQQQVFEVANEWGARFRAKVVVKNPNDDLSDDYVLYFRTGSDPNCGSDGCHSVDSNGQVFGEVFVQDAVNSGNDPLLVGEHELIEMLVDPQANGTEIVDPVVCYTYCEGQAIVPGVPEQDCTNPISRVPDFIFPSKNKDFMGMLPDHPCQIK